MFPNLEEAYKALIPFVVDKTNPMWDGGILSITKESNEHYKVELTGFYYASEEDRQSLKSFETEREISFNNTHKAVYDFLKDYYYKLNPKAQWNSFILEVDASSNYTPHFECNGEEVSPDAPPEPEKITEAYLCENLKRISK